MLLELLLVVQLELLLAELLGLLFVG